MTFLVRDIDRSVVYTGPARMGMTHMPLFLNRPLRRKATVVADNNPPALWMGTYYPQEYVSPFLKGGAWSSIRVQHEVTLIPAGSNWRIVDRQLFGTSKWELGNELDCYRLYTCHADRARGLVRRNTPKASVADRTRRPE